MADGRRFLTKVDCGRCGRVVASCLSQFMFPETEIIHNRRHPLLKGELQHVIYEYVVVIDEEAILKISVDKANTNIFRYTSSTIYESLNPQNQGSQLFGQKDCGPWSELHSSGAITRP